MTSLNSPSFIAGAILLGFFGFYAGPGLSQNSGNSPSSRLLLASDGCLYGESYSGGDLGGGTIYRLTPAGILELVYSFDLSSPDYAFHPLGGLIEGGDGKLYGATAEDVIFSLTKTGTLTILKPISGEVNPAGVIEASDGNLYGVVTGDSPGSVFKLTKGGTYTTFAFNGVNGNYPVSGLVEGDNGDLYGTTTWGGGGGGGPTLKKTKKGVLSGLGANW